MATHDISGLFQNNRRKEGSAVTMTLPAKLADGELRSGTPDTLLGTGDVITLGRIPKGVIITNICALVESVMTGPTQVKLDIVEVSPTATVTALIANVDPTATGLTAPGTAWANMWTDMDYDITATVTGAATAETGAVKLVLEYITVDGNTMSFLGEA